MEASQKAEDLILEAAFDLSIWMNQNPSLQKTLFGEYIESTIHLSLWEAQEKAKRDVAEAWHGFWGQYHGLKDQPTKMVIGHSHPINFQIRYLIDR